MALSDAALAAAHSELPGLVIDTGSSEWDTARHFHSGTGEPDLIIRAQDVNDVVTGVRIARESGLPVSIRAGGHSAWGTVPGGVVIDLAALAEVVVDEGDAPVVHVGGGALWGDVADALRSHDLALSSGDTASVGVGGLTLGGGIGWMVRAWGLACDQLIGAQLVTATGEIVEVSAETHPDLLWALRGGGGNFGVVTRFDFRPHALPAIGWAELGIDGDAREVIAALRDLLVDAPRELTVTYMDVPAMDPSAPAGASITAVWAGDDVPALRAALAPLLERAEVTEGVIERRAYREVLMEMPAADPDAPLPGFIGGNMLVVDLDREIIDQLAAFRASNDASVLFLRSLGGAFGDATVRDQSAFPARNATWFAMTGAFDIPGLITDADRPHIQEAWDHIEARGAGGYGIFSTTTDADFAARMYPGAIGKRLASIKHAWDPGNLFSRNHNVLPLPREGA